MAESKEELNYLLKRVKEESEKSGLKLNIQKTKIMASSPITSWQIDGEKWKQWQIFSSWAPKSLRMAPAAMKLEDTWKESYDQPRQLIHKSRAIIANEGPCSQSYGFPVVMYRCEGWTVKKAECWRSDAFELWCWRRVFESSLDSTEIKPVNPKGNQPWIFIGRTDAEAATPILWLPDTTAKSLGKTLMLRKIEGKRRGWQKLDSITDSIDMNLGKLQ